MLLWLEIGNLRRDQMSDYFKNLNHWSLSIPILVLLIVAMMILPLPPFLLDILFSFNISLSLVILLACVYTQRPLNFSIFPTVLLLATLLRLALNIASTRVVLLHGHSGPYAAGQVIHSFGSVVIGSNAAVGFVVFTILVIVNFVVVTKGATRVSEVSARFTLDAMPGKQNAIDADLNAGLITQATARERRDEVAMEADFYGAMDGASKFVRGDAIACILILFVNLIGGLFIGVLQQGMPIGYAAHIYTLLTIGDGLVAQVPSLLLSIATAIIVTRATKPENMSVQLFTQLFDNPQTLGITSLVLLFIGLIPGMPHVAFLILAMALAGTMYFLQQNKTIMSTKNSAIMNPIMHEHEHRLTTNVNWNDLISLDAISIELGIGLIKLVNDENAPLLQRITQVRKTLTQQIGFLIPNVHVQDSLELKPSQYRIKIMGVNYAEARIEPNKSIAPETVIATHLSHILQYHADQLLGHEEAQQLLDRLATQAPNIVEALVPNTISLSVFVKVLRQLLQEHIPIIDMRNIATTIIDAASQSDDPDYLTQAVRLTLKRFIVQRIAGNHSEIDVITVDPELDSIMHDNNMQLDPTLTEYVTHQIKQYIEQQHQLGKSPVIVCASEIRLSFARFIRRFNRDVFVLSFDEIPENYNLRIVGTLLAV